MNEPKPRQILLCVAGLTPQIVTETLYSLTQERGERVDEIRVITTIAGRDKVMQVLLDSERGKFYEFCRDYQIDPAAIKFNETTIALLRTPDGRTLTDIRTPEENEYAGDQICEIVRELAKDPDSRIHASVAGGRKTMSIYLTAAMQLFGRAQDALSHVLVSEEFELQVPDFFYIPPTPRMLKKRDGQEISTEKAKIYLADIPFIRLQGVMWDRLHRGERRYNQLVHQTQDDLNLLESSHDLIIDLRRSKIAVANRSIKLPVREFFVYILFAQLRKQQDGEEGFVAFDEISRRDLDAAFRLITSARGLERPLEDYDLLPRFDFLGNLSGSISGKDCDSEAVSRTFLEVIAKIKRKFESAGRLDRYLVARRGERGSSRYGLDVAPDRIIFRT
jgi:CRISPR-associated protein (TIGR02584 family)